ncbi:MAG: prephenate dehydratase [Clostridiales bacterium]|jgi:prephenate dehydratase|nr:prephenate dehydratase [Clostridiales bacterium]
MVSNPQGSFQIGQTEQIGYLGPAGTFSQQAAMLVREREKWDGELIPFSSIIELLEAADKFEIKYAVAPLENSTEGAINITLDSLIFELDLFIQRQIVLPISHCLMKRAGTEKISRVYAHSQSLAQCRGYLRTHYPQALCVPLFSNAEAARMVSEGEQSSAAIAPGFAADIYNLKVIAAGIQDQKNNFTTFIVLSGESTRIFENSKTTVAFCTNNDPGALNKILNVFSVWDINMTKIISRPFKNRPGEYVFYVELEDYNNNDLSDALKLLKRKTPFCKYLGSYA